MAIDFGIVKPGRTLYVPFDSFAGSTGASITLTGLAVTDIEIYKDGSVTQRSSDSGYTLLDTDGIDFDGVTGIHGFSINLADNTDAGFYAAGSRYFVVVSSVTVDSQTVSFVACTFSIGQPDAVLNTTIATLSTQTSFTLTAGPAEDDALNNCVVAIHDVASAVQMGFAVVSDYTGSSKTVTLTAGTTFTAAATDNISFFPPSNAAWGGSVAYSTTRGLAGTALPAAAADGAGGLPISDAGGLDLDAKIGALTFGTANRVNAQVYGLEASVITAASIAADAITDAKVASDVTIASVTGAVGSVTGNVGGNVVGSVGSVTGAVGSVTGAVGSVTGNVGGNVTGSVGSLATQAKADVNAEVVDAIATDTYAEPGQGAPAATTSLAAKINYMYKNWRNRKTQTSTTWSLYADDATTVDQKATVADDGSVASKTEVTTGP